MPTARSIALGPYRTASLPQGDIRYREADSGPPIVFLHGLLVNGDLWRRIVPLLADSFRCIVPDLPLGGHLPPMPPDADLSLPGIAAIVNDLLAALELEAVTLVGTNTGGAVSQMVIAHHPERIARLVLANCDDYRNLPPPILLRFVPVSRRLLHATLADHNPGNDVLSSYFTPVIADPGVRRDLAMVLEGASSHDTLAAAETFPRFTKPVLIVWGDDDLIFKKRDARQLAHDFPNARLESVAASRAFVSEDQPEIFARFISDFIAESTNGSH